jgi:DedD protein
MDVVLKQRLVGAVVLVALGVIFIPMLLEGPDDTLVPELGQLPELMDPGPGQPLEAFPTMDTLPAAPDTSVLAADAEPEPQPLAPESELEPVSEPELQPGSAAETPQEPVPQAQNEPATAPDKTTSTPAPASVPRAPAAEAQAGPLGSWVVQVGSFSSQQNAVGLRDKLRQGGFTTQVEKVRVDGKTHYRVRVGPFLQRDEAERSRKQLADKFKLSGRVLSYP